MIATTRIDRGDWVRLGQRWWRVEHPPRSCERCRPGETHLWCRPWQHQQLGPLRFVVAPLAGLAVRRPVVTGERPAPRPSPSGHTETRPAPAGEGRARGA